MKDVLPYSGINTFLEEICCFLEDEIKSGNLSDKSKTIANKLIYQSKEYINDFEKNSSHDVGSDNRYVDMKRTVPQFTTDVTKTEEIEEYCAVSDYSSADSNKIEEFVNDKCPYINLAADQINLTSKNGILERRERILCFEKVRKLFATIHNNWLLIYSGKHDAKPLEFYCLKSWKADPVEDKENNFVLICHDETRQRQLFSASNRKDMKQWICEINTKQVCQPIASELPVLMKLNNIQNEKLKIEETIENEPFYAEIPESPDQNPVRSRVEFEVVASEPQNVANDQFQDSRDSSDDDYDKLVSSIGAHTLTPNKLISNAHEMSKDESNDNYDLVQLGDESSQQCSKLFLPAEDNIYDRVTVQKFQGPTGILESRLLNSANEILSSNEDIYCFVGMEGKSMSRPSLPVAPPPSAVLSRNASVGKRSRYKDSIQAFFRSSLRK